MPSSPNRLRRQAFSTIHIFLLVAATVLIDIKFYSENYARDLGVFSNYIYIFLTIALIGEIAFVIFVTRRLAVTSNLVAQQPESEAIAGCYTGDVLTSMVEREVARAGRAGRALAILMIDVADEAGSAEVVLHADRYRAEVREMVQVIRLSTRTTDVLGQFQPGELALVLPDTPTDHAPIVAAKLRTRLDQMTAGPDSARLTVKLITARQAEDGAGIIWRFDEILEANMV